MDDDMITAGLIAGYIEAIAQRNGINASVVQTYAINMVNMNMAPDIEAALDTAVIVLTRNTDTGEYLSDWTIDTIMNRPYNGHQG